MQVMKRFSGNRTSVRSNRQALLVQEQQRKWSQAERDAGSDCDARREGARLRNWEEDYAGYTEYTRILARLLRTEPSQLGPLRVKIEDLIPRRAAGDPNTIYDLQNYAIGPDSGADFRRIDYFPLPASLRVRNSVQLGVETKPIDFLAMRASDSAIWLYESAFITRTSPSAPDFPCTISRTPI